MTIDHHLARRAFLRHAATLGAVVGGSAAPLALNLSTLGSAAAAGASDYKALVCLFFYGGNDAYNLVLPTDAASWAAYTATRNQAPDPIALKAPGTPADPSAAAGSAARLGGVLPITPLRNSGRGVALHPLMGSLQSLFNTERRLAVVANVGPLVMPTTKAQYAQANHPRPARLFSHNDQQNTWQALGPEGVTQGWGWRMGDLLASQNSQAVFTAISAAGNAVWASGRTVKQYQVSTTGPVAMGVNAAGQVYGSADVGAALRALAGSSGSSDPFSADVAAMNQRAMDAEALLRNALKAASDPLFGTPPASGAYSQSADPKLRYTNPVTGTVVSSGLAQQLQMVARLIEGGLAGTTGAKRQVFFVSLGGFDTHDRQNQTHTDLYARIAHALAYFDNTLGAIGARNHVTLFTASDFGRTLTSNGDGTDHGWGSHHLVLGGAVNGGDLYGNLPTLGPKNSNNSGFDSSPDLLNNGALLPTTSVDQLGATLGRWFGLSDLQLLELFPNLANFNASARDLGFLRA